MSNTFFEKFNVSKMVGNILLAVGLLAGCATEPKHSTMPSAQSYGFTKKESSPTADMNLFQKTGYYTGWIFLDFLYGTAKSNPSFSP